MVNKQHAQLMTAQNDSQQGYSGSSCKRAMLKLCAANCAWSTDKAAEQERSDSMGLVGLRGKMRSPLTCVNLLKKFGKT